MFTELYRSDSSALNFSFFPTQSTYINKYLANEMSSYPLQYFQIDFFSVVVELNSACITIFANEK